jgi:uncharacterized protein YhaN
MRILEIGLLAFGPFSDVTLDLSGPGGFHLIHGPNEAGKSATLRALRCLFFGIPQRTEDNFRHDNKSLRIGARLLHSDGSQLRFYRRKTRKASLLDETGRALPDDALDKYLQGLGEEYFSSLFGIDYESLVRGGEDILKVDGKLGQALFSAGMGGRRLHGILQGLEGEAEGLFKARGRLQHINQLLKDYKDLKKEIAELSLSANEWSSHHRAYHKSLREKAELDQQLRNLETERSRLERLERALKGIPRYRELTVELEELQGVRLLPPDFGEKRRETQIRLRQAEEAQEAARAALLRIEERIGALEIPEALLEQADTAMNLRERLGSHNKAMEDVVALRREYEVVEGEVRGLVKELRPDLPQEEAERLRLGAARRTRIRQLSNRCEALVSEMERARRDCKDTERKLQEKRAELQETPPPGDPSNLRTVAARGRRAGNPEAEQAELREDLQTRREEAEAALQRLGLWSGSLEDLASLAAPSRETVEKHETRLEQLHQRKEKLKERRDEFEERGREGDRQIRELQMAGTVPSEADLERARMHRERGWRLIRLSWLEDREEREEIESFASGLPLADAYEAAVRQSDEIADRLRREAERVTRYASMEAERLHCEEEMARLQAEIGRFEGQAADALEAWRDLWRPLGLEPLSPREMRSWLAEWEKLASRATEIRERKRRLESLDASIEELRCSVGVSLEALEEEGARPGEPLVEMLDRAQAVVERLQETARRRTNLDAEVQELEYALEEAGRESREAEEKLARWRAEWAEALKDLGLHDSATPEEAGIVLGKIEDLSLKLDRLESLQGRIKGIERDAADFAERVLGFVTRYLPDLATLPPEEAVVRLHSRLAQAREDDATRKQLEEQKTEQQTQLERSWRTIQECEMRRDEMCREAGCEDPEELPEAEEKSERRRRLTEEWENLHGQLTELAAGGSLEELLREAESVDADELPGRLVETGERIRELRERKSEVEQTIGSERTELQKMDGGGDAARAAERLQEVRASIREGVDRYVQLKLAAAVLRREIERYRKESQDPVLSRAGHIFARLTAGSFELLRPDFEGTDEPVLLGVRPSGEEVGVQGMSDGTRDQLHLSLRLATLERYLERNEPMPLIVDDILVNFDDTRAAATLQVLEELSGLTQIIFFTHHRHLVELAQANISSEKMHVHGLGQNGIRA